MIAISLSPNTETDDVRLAFAELMTPWRWFSQTGGEHLIKYFQQTYPSSKPFLYNSGRSALYEILKAFNISAGDEVIIQAFTCVAVPNSILWVGATPVYADIDESYNLNIESVQKKITKKTKAIIVQHTLGIPAEIDKLAKFATAHNLLLIEDCAHSLGATYKGRTIGTWGDASFFSFGRDKVLSSVFGGVAIVSSKHRTAIEKIELSHASLNKSRTFWVFQQLFHPVAFALILQFYSIGLGKLFLVALQRLNLLSFPVYKEEKRGDQPADFPAQYPGALVRLASHQIKKLSKYNQNRKNIAEYYHTMLKENTHVTLPPHSEGSIYLRFPILVSNPKKLLQKAKLKGMLLGNWYHSPVDPQGVEFRKVGYIEGSCPQAEYTGLHMLNLPTRITKEEAQQVVELIHSETI